jgi:hypothetical protein
MGRPLSEGCLGESEGRLMPAEELEVDMYFGSFPAPVVVPAGLEYSESKQTQ